MTSLACTRRTARTLAAAYVGLMAVIGLVSGISTGAESASWAQYATLPGSVLLFAFLILPLVAIVGTSEEAIMGPFGSLIWFSAAAIVNVLLVWGAMAFCRVVKAEWRR